MENRQTPSYPPYQSSYNRMQSQEAYIGRDGSESYNSSTRHFRQPQGQLGRAEDLLHSAQRVNLRRPAPNPVHQATSAASAGQRGNKLQEPGSATALHQSLHTASPLTPNDASFNSSVSAEYGSQFDPHEYAPQGLVPDSFHYPDPGNYGSTSSYPDSYQSGSSEIGAFHAAIPLREGHLLPDKFRSRDVDTSMTTSPTTRTFSSPEPWALIRSNASFKSQHHLPATPGPADIYPDYNCVETSNRPLPSTSASPYQHHDLPYPPRSELRSGGMGLVTNFKNTQHNFSNGKSTDELAYCQVATHTTSAPIDYVQGRRTTLELPNNGPVEHVPSKSTGTWSQQDVSGTTRSARDTSDRPAKSTVSRNHHSSLNTSISTTTTTSITTRSSTSARRDLDDPDPLLCFECSKPFRGPDRRTNRRRHYREIHQKFRVTCQTCHKEFSRLGNLKRHISTKHPSP